MGREIEKTDDDWRAQLTPERYAVLRRKGTEQAFTGTLLSVKDDGTFVCAGCGAELFRTDAKFESGSGWPSFTEPSVGANIETVEDRSHGMTRTEVLCRRCGGHLGHVFDDGPAPTGLRYCINSAAMEFDPDR